MFSQEELYGYKCCEACGYVEYMCQCDEISKEKRKDADDYYRRYSRETLILYLLDWVYQSSRYVTVITGMLKRVPYKPRSDITRLQ